MTKNATLIIVNSAVANGTGNLVSAVGLAPSAAALDVSCTGATFTIGQGCYVGLGVGSLILDARL
jgi:hypothetical protein